MSVKDLISLAGVPGLEPAIALLANTYEAVVNVKLYRTQCEDISSRCVDLMVSLRDSAAGLEGQRPMELVDEINHVAERINKRVTEWAALSRLRSFISQRDIKEGIDKLQHDIDIAVIKFNMQLNLEIVRFQQEAKAIQERDRAEMRELLEKILLSNDDRRMLVNAEEPEVLHEVMQVLQTELRNSESLEPKQEENFREGLWWLHDQTAKLPPLTDLTGQVTLDPDQSGVAKAQGTFNDIFLGQWLDHEPVALRLPRALTNSPDNRRRLQREVKIWRSLERHPNVVPLYGLAYIGSEVYCVSPWMDNGTVVSFVQRCPSADRLRMLTEIATGLEYLHLHSVIHGDLRGANVLINREQIAKISDFGLSKVMEECGEDMTISPGFSARWAAPELFRTGGSYSTQSDVWSFGMVMYELLTGKVPFHSIPRDANIIREVDHGKLPEKVAQMAVSKEHWDKLWMVMKSCWQKKPSSRPSMTSLKNKLLEIRGLSPTVKKSRLPSISFSVTKRPSTAGSDSSIKSSSSRKRLSSLSPLLQGQPLPPSPSFSSYSTENGLVSSPVDIPTRVNHRNWSSSPAVTEQHDFIGLDFEPISSSLPAEFGSHFPLSHSPSEMSLASPPINRAASEGGSMVFDASAEDMVPSAPILLPPLVSTDSIIVNVDSRGSVVSGTLEGLVDKLMSTPNLKQDLEYRDVMLTMCPAFASPMRVFQVLARRFQDAERPDVPTSKRVELQHGIYVVVLYWLSNTHLPIDPPLLAKMKEFCVSGISAKRSSTMNDKAREILRAIEARSARVIPPSPSIRPGKVPKGDEIEPEDLAVALTFREAEKFRDILPGDYLLHAIQPESESKVDNAQALNARIQLWVKMSLLHSDLVDARLLTLKFVILAAKECRRLRNFASMSAIVKALNSNPISGLTRMREMLASNLARDLDEMTEILNPTSGHRRYHKIYHESPVAVPWLDVHLDALHGILTFNKPLIQSGGRSLINFGRYVSFVEHVKEIRRVRIIERKEEHERAVAYLESNLRHVERTAHLHTDENLMARSRHLQVADERDYRSRRIPLQELGFKTRK